MPLPSVIRHDFVDGDAQALVHAPHHDDVAEGVNAIVEYLDGVAQCSLASAVALSHQEGGATILRGTFTPLEQRVEIDVRVSGDSNGFAGHQMRFAIGVLPFPAPTPWEGGSTPSRITKCDNSSFNPLDGVTEYQRFELPRMMPDMLDSLPNRRIVLTGLTVDQQYEWEIRCAGESFSKSLRFASGSDPNFVVMGGEKYTCWVSCTGSSELYLINRGWSTEASFYELATDPLLIGKVAMPGVPYRLAVQPGTFDTEDRNGTNYPTSSSRYVATIDVTNKKLVIVDSWTFTVVGSYALPGGDDPTFNNALWNAAGTKVWIGSTSAANGGRIHRFDLATLAFDQSVTINATASATAYLLGRFSDDTLLVSDYSGGTSGFSRFYKVNPTTFALTAAGGNGGYFVAATGACMSDGTFLVLDLTGVIHHLSGTGTPIATIDTTAGASTGGNLQLSPDEQQVYFSCNKSVGWAWIGSAQLINSAQWWGSTNAVGEVCVTEDEGIITAVPNPTSTLTHEGVWMWPGGILQIQPDPTLSSWGSQHAIVTFSNVEAASVG